MATVKVNNVSIHYQRFGHGGPMIVFLHGLIMDNLSGWYFNIARSVAHHAEVLLYDLRGHGLSDRPSSGYQLSDFIEELHQLLNVLNVKRPIILSGFSFGGLLAIAFTRRYPEQVAKLILVEAHVSHLGWGDKMAKSLSLRGKERERVVATLFGHFSAQGKSEGKISRLAEKAKKLITETTIIRDISKTPALSDGDLRQLRIPTLAIYGGRSDLCHHGQRLKENLPNVALHICRKCSHNILWEDAETIRTYIAEWQQN